MKSANKSTKTGLKVKEVSKDHFSSNLNKKDVLPCSHLIVRLLQGFRLLASDVETGKSDPVCFLKVVSIEDPASTIMSDAGWKQPAVSITSFTSHLRKSNKTALPSDSASAITTSWNRDSIESLHNIKLGTVYMSKVCQTTVDPIWNEDIIIPIPIHDINDLFSSKLIIYVRDEDINADGSTSYDDLGMIEIPLRDFMAESRILKNALVLSAHKYPLKKTPAMRRVDGSIKLTLSMVFAEEDCLPQIERSDLGLESMEDMIKKLKSVSKTQGKSIAHVSEPLDNKETAEFAEDILEGIETNLDEELPPRKQSKDPQSFEDNVNPDKFKSILDELSAMKEKLSQFEPSKIFQQADPESESAEVIKDQAAESKPLLATENINYDDENVDMLMFDAPGPGDESFFSGAINAVKNVFSSPAPAPVPAPAQPKVEAKVTAVHTDPTPEESVPLAAKVISEPVKREMDKVEEEKNEESSLVGSSIILEQSAKADIGKSKEVDKAKEIKSPEPKPLPSTSRSTMKSDIVKETTIVETRVQAQSTLTPASASIPVASTATTAIKSLDSRSKPTVNPSMNDSIEKQEKEIKAVVANKEKQLPSSEQDRNDSISQISKPEPKSVILEESKRPVETKAQAKPEEIKVEARIEASSPSTASSSRIVASLKSIKVDIIEPVAKADESANTKAIKSAPAAKATASEPQKVSTVKPSAGDEVLPSKAMSAQPISDFPKPLLASASDSTSSSASGNAATAARALKEMALQRDLLQRQLEELTRITSEGLLSLNQRVEMIEKKSIASSSSQKPQAMDTSSIISNTDSILVGAGATSRPKTAANLAKKDDRMKSLRQFKRQALATKLSQTMSAIEDNNVEMFMKGADGDIKRSTYGPAIDEADDIVDEKYHQEDEDIDYRPSRQPSGRMSKGMTSSKSVDRINQGNYRVNWSKIDKWRDAGDYISCFAEALDRGDLADLAKLMEMIGPSPEVSSFCQLLSSCRILIRLTV
jgi:hypothetical protein